MPVPKRGLPEKLVLYCGRHDFETELLRRTADMALVLNVMAEDDYGEVKPR